MRLFGSGWRIGALLVAILSADGVAAGNARGLEEGEELTAHEMRFAKAIARAVRRNDAQWLARAVDYPIWVCIGDRHTAIRDRQQFLRHYRTIINDRVRDAVLRTYAGEVRKNGYQSIALGRGEIWFEGLTYYVEQPPRFFIRSINNDPRAWKYARICGREREDAWELYQESNTHIAYACSDSLDEAKEKLRGGDPIFIHRRTIQCHETTDGLIASANGRAFCLPEDLSNDEIKDEIVRYQNNDREVVRTYDLYVTRVLAALHPCPKRGETP